jgi:hypothetical protein
VKVSAGALPSTRGELRSGELSSRFAPSLEMTGVTEGVGSKLIETSCRPIVLVLFTLRVFSDGACTMLKFTTFLGSSTFYTASGFFYSSTFLVDSCFFI